MNSKPVGNESLPWQTLATFRQIFLQPHPSGCSPYWQSDELLDAYHRTFGERIRWKWQSVLRDIATRHTLEQIFPRAIIDFGCGTGIGTLAVLDALVPGHIRDVILFDHSDRARRFATLKIREFAPLVAVREASAVEELKAFAAKNHVLLVASHVLSELNAPTKSSLSELASLSTATIFVDAGTKDVASKMGVIRNHLLTAQHEILAPCRHQLPCPLRDSQEDWCHFFAKVPPEIFHSSFWREFSTQLKIDLRSLPFSYLLTQSSSYNEQKNQTATTPLPSPTKGRVIGRPRVFKAWAEVMLCSESGEMNQLKIHKAREKDRFRSLKKSDFCDLGDWCE